MHCSVQPASSSAAAQLIDGFQNLSINALPGSGGVDEREHVTASMDTAARASSVILAGEAPGNMLFSQTSQGLMWTTDDDATASVENSQRRRDAPSPEPQTEHDVSLIMVAHDPGAASNAPPSASYSVHTSSDEFSRNQQPTANYSGAPVAVNAETISGGSNWANQAFVSVLNSLTKVYLHYPFSTQGQHTKTLHLSTDASSDATFDPCWQKFLLSICHRDCDCFYNFYA
jgi:hypothetical protein